MLIDFKEIPPANKGGGYQDEFELFARDFLSLMGYEIVGEPARGADGGIDIKVKEIRKGIGGCTEIFWLVSCKHYAHSTGAISPEIESNIFDRVMSNKCQGFIGFYTNIATSGLKNMLDGFSSRIEYQLFDREKIESRIVGIRSSENLFIRYFPISYKKWKEVYYYLEPIKLFEGFINANFKSSSEIMIFNAVFGSTGHFIKSLRNNSNYKEAFAANDHKVFIDNDYLKYNYRKDINFLKSENPLSIISENKEKLKFVYKDKYHPFLDYLSGTIRPPSGKGLIRFDYDHGKHLKYRYNLEVVPKLIYIIRKLSFADYIFLFKNFVILDEGYDNELEEIFQKLKQVLD